MGRRGVVTAVGDQTIGSGVAGLEAAEVGDGKGIGDEAGEEGVFGGISLRASGIERSWNSPRVHGHRKLGGEGAEVGDFEQWSRGQTGAARPHKCAGRVAGQCRDHRGWVGAGVVHRSRGVADGRIELRSVDVWKRVAEWLSSSDEVGAVIGGGGDACRCAVPVLIGREEESGISAGCAGDGSSGMGTGVVCVDGIEEDAVARPNHRFGRNRIRERKPGQNAVVIYKLP